MSAAVSQPLALRARGPLACFTRPELKVERVSYPVMTPSAARGLLEAVLWKPAIRWRVERIQVLAPISFVAFRRNEVTTKGAAPPRDLVDRGGAVPVLLADDPDRRAQRNTVALRDVDYVVEARLELTSRAGPADNVRKFEEMFQRRVQHGQHFHQPYLGCREFAAEVLPVEGAPAPRDDEQRDLGIILWDIAFRREGNVPLFFDARLERGILHVPPEPTYNVPQGGRP